MGEDPRTARKTSRVFVLVERKKLDVYLVVEFDACPQRHPAS